MHGVSIHASRAGRDWPCPGRSHPGTCFNPRVPCGTRQYWGMASVVLVCFNPRVPCGTRLGALASAYTRHRVSIHASRAGRDPLSRMTLTFSHRFNPRVPCGTRPRPTDCPTARPTFQSTRPVRDATVLMEHVHPQLMVSIHASRAGRDGKPISGINGARVSIHASRAGRDKFCIINNILNRCFNPRVPCGTRPLKRLLFRKSTSFQSTRPVRDATSDNYLVHAEIAFQSTRPVRDATVLYLFNCDSI